MAYSFQKRYVATPQVKRKMILSVLLFFLCMSVLPPCIHVHLGTRVTDGSKTPWHWELNPGPLQQMLLIAEPALQSLHLNFSPFCVETDSTVFIHGWEFWFCLFFFLTNDSTNWTCAMHSHCPEHTPLLISIKACNKKKIFLFGRVKTS